MAKTKTKVHFLCGECGSVQLKWMGRCPECGAWGSLEEFRESPPAQGASVVAETEPAVPLPLPDVDESQVFTRIPTGISELDRVLGGADEVGSGGGLVPGGVVLIGGDPGIGKSTLLMQASSSLAHQGKKVLYVTSEESAQQLKRRALRLLGENLPQDFLVLAETSIQRTLEQAKLLKPDLLVLDSLQMFHRSDLPAAPGSVTQLRACCLDAVHLAKALGIATLFVGHVTKEGGLAGPRLLEHMVDAVLYFEGDRYHAHRVVRAIKNRYGNTLEAGLFEMGDQGLSEVAAGAGLMGAAWQPRQGAIIVPALHGSRCVLVEVQALAAGGFPGSVKRKVSGLDAARLSMLVAVLEKHGGLHLGDQDIFVQAVGGLKVPEPAADLSVLLAIAGAFLRREIASGTVAVGEVGLSGEVRPVQQLERRVIEAVRLGFKRILLPASAEKISVRGAELLPVKTVSEALGYLN